ncbi:hypothetical protein [Neisseria iguanae]|uniref:hypothetical protein n=1 Tax=Neisseria iguanae TaxID=90242 RepID=UPI001B8042D6|nr:hypothetical protein [Neisseria iguanae]
MMVTVCSVVRRRAFRLMLAVFSKQTRLGGAFVCFGNFMNVSTSFPPIHGALAGLKGMCRLFVLNPAGYVGGELWDFDFNLNLVYLMWCGKMIDTDIKNPLIKSGPE